MLVAGSFLFLFLHAVKKGQYDDTYTPSVRMLFDDSTPADPTAPSQETLNIKN
jgi:cbb3-type cytochrome oxidase maturation protein